MSRTEDAEDAMDAEASHSASLQGMNGDSLEAKMCCFMRLQLWPLIHNLVA